ncbi:Uncharacterized protein Adt_10392 [Abeliophyllum distichum]|uniref:SWIM-type domain-containing protein n=1 Tax=Abeliophyllum distichum TaxID=126358 RepID=A0ABD1UKT3_9LAMI
MILSILISIQKSFMKRIRLRRDRMKSYTGRLCPKIVRKLEREIAMSDGCTLDWSGGPQYQVNSPSGVYVVDLEARTCACRKWDLTGIPCCHAVAVIRDTRNDPEDYVDNCYTVESYLQCYNNILLPINGKELWPLSSCHIKAPTWIVPKKRRQQKKRRRQADEDFIHQSQSQSKLKRKGQVVMTCSECGLQGHNKRYHLRLDAPNDEWYNAPLRPVGNEMETPLGARTKLVPNRGSDGTSTESEHQHTTCQFMPTPGIDMRGIREGPAATSIDVEGGNIKENASSTNVRMEEIDISPMVDELERYNNEEAATRRCARANARRNYSTRSSRFVPPR